MQGQLTEAATQTGPESLHAPRTTTKHVRFVDSGGDTSQAHKRPAIEVAGSRRVVHINPEGYVPRPLDMVTDVWVTENSVRYIYKIMAYTNDRGYWFPIHRVSPAGSWVVVDENPLVMHRVHLGRPLLVWIVGVLHDIHLIAPRAGALPILHATIDFVREYDRSQAISIHNAAASLPIASIGPLTVTSPTCDDEGLQAHNEVYDCRRMLQRKSAMSTISPGRMLGGDIVLLECTVVRREEPANVRSVKFVLNSVYWLVEKPRPATVETQHVSEFPDVISVD